MSRPSRPRKLAVPKPETSGESTVPASVITDTGEPNPAAPPQPETTGAASAPAPVSAATAAEAAAAPVDPKSLEPAKPAATPKPKPTARVLTVKGPAKGRWRAGRHFGPEEVQIPADDLTEMEIERLEGDPELHLTWSA